MTVTCDREDFDGRACTRVAGHTGWHVCRVNGRIVARWRASDAAVRAYLEARGRRT